MAATISPHSVGDREKSSLLSQSYSLVPLALANERSRVPGDFILRPVPVGVRSHVGLMTCNVIALFPCKMIQE